ncbi:MAG: phosphate acyltransferase PlsX [Mariprofundaceae bacterium]
MNPSESQPGKEGDPARQALAVAQPPVRILLDGHGGDHAPEAVLDAAREVLAGADAEGVMLGVVGLADVLSPMLEARGLAERVVFVPSEDVVDMCDSPAQALRRKRKSSMHIGAKAVRDGEWEAFVSAGNTGALMAISKLVLKTLPGVDRPAIASMLPAREETRTLFLDVGANVDCNSDHLIQFALMGHCYMQAEGIESPRIGLLNIGAEEIKGTDVIKLAAARLADLPLNFIGNVEGDQLFDADVDVVVADGFVGNVALKTMEGTARFLADNMKQELLSGLLAKAGALLSSRALARFRERVNPGRYNGAPLLGLNGIVIKSHGSADATAYANAIRVAARQVRAGLLDRIEESMQAWGMDTVGEA